MADAGEDTPQKVDAKLAAQWRARNAAQLAKIHAAAKGNLELQMLILGTIESYYDSQTAVAAQGTSIQAAMSKSSASSKAGKTASQLGGGQCVQIISPDMVIGKGRAVYHRWGKFLLEELIQFITGGELDTGKLTKKERYLEMLEFSLGITASTRIPTPEVKKA